MAKKVAKGSIEHSLERLEEIVGILEEGKVPLDEALELFEEGIQISKECGEKLKAAELRIRKLTKTIDGTFELTEFEEEEEDEEENS